MSSASSFKFLVTTDNHMGYKHNDFIRSEDSYLAFAEALQVARDKDVDFILLGGDLFHMSRPSASVEHKCIQILRHHMNFKADRSTSFRLVSGKFCHYEKVNHANFEDPHLTVPYPIMTIHGNHDDLTGPMNQSVCSKLATCGLLNYFGLPTQTVTKMTVEPIVFQKDDIKIALYGIGFMADGKLKVAFEKKEVHFMEPPQDSFNVLVVHQNRVAYEESKYIPDDMYPDFFHLIVRGHEHDLRKPEPHTISKVNGLVYQPGSTVATSIASKEGGNKFVGLMEVKINDANGGPTSRYNLEYSLVQLQSCRAMLFKDIPQKDIFKYIKRNCGANKLTPVEYRQHSQKYVEEVIRSMLKEYNSAIVQQQSPSAEPLTKRARKSPKRLPLVRVRLEYVSKSERFHNMEIGQQFYPNEIANPDIVLFKRQTLIEKSDGQRENITFQSETLDEEEVDEFDFVDLTTEKKDTIESALEEYFLDKPKDKSLRVLSINEYIDAIRGSCEDGNIISKVVKLKKQEVLHMFYAQLTSESVAESRYHNPQAIERWLLENFKGGKTDGPVKIESGDAYGDTFDSDMEDVVPLN